jgi:predicted Mrr-cat superfamily restriction endonuclease
MGRARTPTVAVWTVKGGRHGEREERCLEHGVVGGGWEQIPDLSNLDNRDALNALCEQAAPDWAAKKRANYVAQLWSLRERMQLDELVVLPLKTTGTIAVGRVSGPYAYRQVATDLAVCACLQGRHVRFTTLAVLANEQQEAETRHELGRPYRRRRWQPECCLP